MLETDRFCAGFHPKQILMVSVSLSNCNYSPCIVTCKWGLWRPFRNKPSTNTQIKKAIKTCLALEYFAISSSTGFVAEWILINDPCLPQEDKRRIVPNTVGLEGLQKAWTPWMWPSHAMGCVWPKTHPGSPSLLALQSLRDWTLDADIQGKPWIIMAWWRLVRDTRISLKWKGWKFHLAGN